MTEIVIPVKNFINFVVDFFYWFHVKFLCFGFVARYAREPGDSRDWLVVLNQDKKNANFFLENFHR